MNKDSFEYRVSINEICQNDPAVFTLNDARQLTYMFLILPAAYGKEK